MSNHSALCNAPGTIIVRPYAKGKSAYRARLYFGSGFEKQFYGATYDEAEAKALKHKRAFAEIDPIFVLGAETYKELPLCFLSIYTKTVNNAKARNISHSLSKEDFVAICKAAQGCCTYSGIPFSLVTYGYRGNRKPFAPSLDRIDASKGYSRDNCRLICGILNYAFNEWGDAPFVRLLVFMQTGNLSNEPQVL